MDMKHSQDSSDSEPPAYAAAVLLYPTTADASTRYTRVYHCVQSTEFTISAGLHTDLNIESYEDDVDDTKTVSVDFDPLANPSPWARYVHPEGATFYMNSLINVVTDSNILSPGIFNALMEGVGQVRTLAANCEAKITGDIDLYVRAEEATSCHYYMVNHNTRTEFWLNDNELADMGFSRVVSKAHLRYVLEEHYWTHVEYFPTRPISKPLLRELISVLRHGQLDHETSRSSTFPFDASQCKRFIKLLTVDDEETQSMYYISMAARLWTSISKHRFDNMYGEEFARLDRNTRRREDNSDREPFYMKVASTALFDCNRSVTKKIDDLYVDETTYTMHWRKFMADIYESWGDYRLESTVLLIASAILVSHPRGILDYYVGLAAIACSALSLVSSVMLRNKFHDKLQFVALDAVAYLADQKHKHLGFQPLGLLMSIPQGLTTWSIIIFLTQVFSIIVESTGAPFLLTFVVVFGALAVVILLIITRFLAATLLDIWRRRRRQYGCPV